MAEATIYTITGGKIRTSRKMAEELRGGMNVVR